MFFIYNWLTHTLSCVNGFWVLKSNHQCYNCTVFSNPERFKLRNVSKFSFKPIKNYFVSWEWCSLEWFFISLYTLECASKNLEASFVGLSLFSSILSSRFGSQFSEESVFIKWITQAKFEIRSCAFSYSFSIIAQEFSEARVLIVLHLLVSHSSKIFWQLCKNI